jgi:DNA polymerase I-like protein with 3'-5' exonuclease and polymerase domains
MHCASDANLTGAMESYDELTAKKLDFHMFALVHDSIVSEVKDEDVDEYISIVKRNLQADIGISIEGCPICVDFGVGESYAEA